MTMAAINKHWLQAVVVCIMAYSICCASEALPSLTYTCPPTLQDCDCPTTKPLMFNCPQFQTKMPLMYTLMYDIDVFHLTMDCSTEDLDYSLLKFSRFQFPRVDTFTMRNCPLPNSSIGSVIESLNISSLKISPLSRVDMLRSNLFQNLSQIEHLDIEGGNIKAIENGSFKDLTSLRSLKIAQNALTDFPANIFDEMPALVSLNLDSNMIETLPANAFDKLPQLQNLSLNFNHIKNLNETVFQNLLNLRNLMISNNLLESLGADVFKSLAQMEFIDLSYTKLSDLPETLFQNNGQLKTIKLQMNLDLVKLPALFFKNVVLLERLELDRNNLTEIPPELFSTLQNLRVLDLSRNRIQVLPNGLVNNNMNLTEIDLSVNQLTALPVDLFHTQTELKIVRLHNNKLTTVPKLVFSSKPTLETLDLSDNEISVIDEHAFEGSDNITSLDLSYNNLRVISDSLSIPQNIKYLNFSHNNLTKFPEHEWHNVPYILLINLTNNHLESVTVPQLMFKSNKVTVDMRRNEIHTVNLLNLEKYYTPSTNKPDVPSTKSVPSIFIEQNPINCDCNLLSFVRYVKLHNNDVDAPFRFHANSLKCASPNDRMLLGKKLSSLNDDYLYCEVKELCDERCICKLSSVSKTLTMDCSPGSHNNYTRLKEFPKIAPANTSKLYLQNNNITTLSVLKETTWRNLTEVYLSGNDLHLDDIPVHIPERLQLLELSNNKIESMPKWLMTEVSYKDDLSLVLGGNPWRCDCTTVNFHQWLSTLGASKISDPSQIKCGNGTHEGEKLVKLRLSKFCIHHRAGPAGPILVSVFSALVLLGVAVIAGVLLTRNRHRIKMWCFRHKMCLWMRTQDDIEAGHPL